MKVALLILALVFVPVLWSTNPSPDDFRAFLEEQHIQQVHEEAPVLLFGRRERQPDEPPQVGPFEREDFYLFSVYTHTGMDGRTHRYLALAKRILPLD